MIKSKKDLSLDAEKLHILFNKIEKKFNCFDGDVFKMLNLIPHAAGLIIFFEKGEVFQGKDRIVFVGETDDFYERICAYYRSHAKLVTHIRDALGNKLGKSVLQRDANEYIQKNMSFVLIPLSEKKERLHFNKRILSTLSYCDNFKASKDWLGNYAPKQYEVITHSRLWAVKYPFGDEIMEEKDFERLKELISMGA